MINIKKEITNPQHFTLTKTLLYRTRREKGLEAYEIMKRLIYAAYRMCGKNGFITYNVFLGIAFTWLNSKEHIYEFMKLGYRLEIFGLNVYTILKGTYAQIEQEILNLINNIHYE